MVADADHHSKMTPTPRFSAIHADDGRALAPIRFLVLGAFLSAILAVIVLFASVLHVMSTTDSISMEEERNRAVHVADILPHIPDDEMDQAVAELGLVAGLDTLRIVATPPDGIRMQSIPLLGGPRGGMFLAWHAASPGTQLLTAHAPTRVPLILLFIGGVLGCLLAMLRHVRLLEKQRLHAEEQAKSDHLTRLPNRVALDAELSRLAEANEPFSLFALDLDRFKPINDMFGHHMGDQALIEVSQRLMAGMREGEMLARVGGDEFVAVVRRGQRRDNLSALAEAWIANVGMPLQSVGRNVSVGVSIGIVENGLAQPPVTLLKQADRALYEAKRGDGGGYRFSGSNRPPPSSPLDTPRAA